MSFERKIEAVINSMLVCAAVLLFALAFNWYASLGFLALRMSLRQIEK